MLHRDPPPSQRQTRTVLLAAALAATLVLLVLLMLQARDDRPQARERLQAVAEVLALQAAPHLQANDAAAATAGLAALAALPQVRSAVLQRSDGSVLARYQDPRVAALPAAAVQAGRVPVEQAVVLGNRQLGLLRLDADMVARQQGTAGLALLLAGAAAVLAGGLVLTLRRADPNDAPAPRPAAATPAPRPEAPASGPPPLRVAAPRAAEPPPAAPAPATMPARPKADETPVPQPQATPALRPAEPPPAAAVPAVATPAERLPARVLLAEDNQVNREIATVMLGAMGCKVIQAHDGAQALAAVLSKEIDLVLMDCGMPVMDGFESTRRIRAWERDQPGRARVPIVALTASAQAGDREACLSAGMDDYLAKPVSSSRLAETLARHLSGSGRGMLTQAATPGPGDAPAPAAQRPPVYDASVLAALPMVADGSQPEFVARMQRLFTESNARTLDEIDAALASADNQWLMRLLHSMKSASAQVGAMELSALARTFEYTLRTGGSAEDHWPAQLRQAFERLLAAWPESHSPADSRY